MDIIFIRGLSVTSIIGIHDYERFSVQKLVFDFDIGYTKIDKDRVEVHNSIGNSYLDYQTISNVVTILVKKSRFFLLESIAEYVAEELIIYFNIPWIRVVVSKPGAMSKDVCVGIVIERKKEDVIF